MNDELSFKDEQWTYSHSSLFSTVFPLSNDQHRLIPYPATDNNPNYSLYDTLHLEGLVDHRAWTFSVSDQYKQDDLVRFQIENNLANYLKQIPQPETLSFMLQTCPYCETPLTKADHQFNDDDYYNVRIGGIETCSHCHYWQWHHLESRYIGRWSVDAYKYSSYLSKVIEFEEELPDHCSSELAQWFKRDTDRWNSINPHKFERLVADIFRANHAQAEVIHIGKPDDGGVDILFIDTNHKKWLIQAKRRENPKKGEPIGTIRNLLGTMILEGSLYGIVVSTADHFTYRAYQAVARAKEKGMFIKLVDRGILDRMLVPLLPNREWLIPLRRLHPNFAEYFDEVIPNPFQLSLFGASELR